MKALCHIDIRLAEFTQPLYSYLLGLLDVPVDDGPQAVDVHVLQQLLQVPHAARRRRTLLLLLHLQRGVRGGGIIDLET